MKINNRTLFFGDNLKILREKFPSNDEGYFDLIYLDPPFNSKKDYNILFKEGLQNSPAQVHAFEDSWHWGEESQNVFEELIGVKESQSETSVKIIDLMLGLEKIIGHNDMMAYLTMMTIRLIELRCVLKDTGTIYLHCDPTASHYLKIVMDAIFGEENFKDELIWHYTKMNNTTKGWIQNHDVILFYTKSSDYIFNVQYSEEESALYSRLFKLIDKDNKLRWYKAKSIKQQLLDSYISSAKKRIGRDLVDDDVIIDFENKGKKKFDNVWYIPIIKGNSKEFLGYPTQKPEALLERIIQASSNKGDWILDPFCGCGTTISVAEKYGRNWIGIDVTSLAVNIIKHRLENEQIEKYRTGQLKIIVDGLPCDMHGVHSLAEKDKFEFQYWALDLIGAMPLKSKYNKKGADGGIDGIYTYQDKTEKDVENINKRMIVSVKGGKNISVRDIRDLKGVIEREHVEGGIFLTLYEPTRPMRTEAALSGHFKNTLYNKEYPKLQIITIAELMDGKQPDLPSGVHPITYYKEATKIVKLDSSKQKKLIDE